MAKLAEIVNGRNIPYIECRCKYSIDGKTEDEFIGSCSVINGEVFSHDGDTYSLNDNYEEWKEFKSKDTCEIEGYSNNNEIKTIPLNSGDLCLRVWECSL